MRAAKRKRRWSRQKKKRQPGGHGPPGETALNRPTQKPSTPYERTRAEPSSNLRTNCPVLNSEDIGQTPAFDQLLFPRFPVVPKAWPPQTKRRWRLGRRSRCPKFFARYRSQNFDRCHSFLLASSAAGGARKRPRFAKRYRGGCGDWPFLMVFASISTPPSPRRRRRFAMRQLAGVVDETSRNLP